MISSLIEDKLQHILINMAPIKLAGCGTMNNTNWVPLLETVAFSIRESVKDVLEKGLDVAGESFEIGAGGDISKRIDMVAEERLVHELKKNNIDFTLLSEESGLVDYGSQDIYVVVDPVDGTVNALRGIPFYNTSLAIAEGPSFDEIVAGLVLNLVTGDVYTAQRGKGAFLNNIAVTPSQQHDLQRSVICIDMSRSSFQEMCEKIKRLGNNTGSIRHMGANAEEMCFVGTGRYEAFVDVRNKARVVDIAAGFIFVKEAGGFVCNMQGDEIGVPLTLETRTNVIAVANSELRRQILSLLTGLF